MSSVHESQQVLAAPVVTHTSSAASTAVDRVGTEAADTATAVSTLQDGVEPVSWTAIAIAVGTGIAATAIYEGCKAIFSSYGEPAIKVRFN